MGGRGWSGGHDARRANGDRLHHVSFAREGHAFPVEEKVDASGIAGFQDDVGAGADGYLHAWVDAARLTPGDYSLSLEPESGAAGTAQEFAFRLQAAQR